MNTFHLLAAAAAAAGLLVATPAAAVVKIATYSGTLLSGYDETGVFGAAGADLAGSSWVAKFTYDKTLGGNQSTDGSSFDDSWGGAGWGYPGMSPVIAVTITINGMTRSLPTYWTSWVNTDTRRGTTHSVEYYFEDGIVSRDNSVYISNNLIGAPWSLDENFGPVAATGSYGYVDWRTYDYATSSYTAYAYAAIGSDAVYSVGNAVPEPASWALMIAGFGMVGAAMRRRPALRTAAA